jgi:membrane fusion protein (multidrug efflux system)
MSLDQAVKQGDVLIELDSRVEQLRLQEQRVLRASLPNQLDKIDIELAAQQRALERTMAAGRAGLEEAQARAREAETPAQLAELDSQRTSRLHEEGLVSNSELSRVQADARERQAAADGRRLAVQRQASERDATLANLRARVAELGRVRARLQGELASASASIASLEQVVEERRIRAPAAGRVGDIVEVRVGDVVEDGTPFGTVVPDGQLKVISSFVAGEAVGRLARGQPARLRLDGFPWTQYGSLAATVVAVGEEARDGLVRVELRLLPDRAPAVQAQHGLLGVVEVEVERVSPATLVLRTAVPYLFPRRQPSASPSSSPTT